MANCKRLCDEYVKFVNGSNSNAWVKNGGGLELYLRKGRRLFRNRISSAIEIANISMPEKMMGRGMFTEFLNFVEQNCPYDYVFVENVLSARFEEWLVRRGFTVVPGQFGGPNSCIKRVDVNYAVVNPYRYERYDMPHKREIFRIGGSYDMCSIVAAEVTNEKVPSLGTFLVALDPRTGEQFFAVPYLGTWGELRGGNDQCFVHHRSVHEERYRRDVEKIHSKLNRALQLA